MSEGGKIMEFLGSKWVTIGAIMLAGVSLFVAIGASNASGQLRDDLLAMQTRIDDASDQASGALLAASSGLAVLADQPLTLTVNIAEEIPIQASFPFERELIVPIQTSIPIDETIETTVQVAGPFGLDIPVTIAVPIQLDVPIDLEVPISVSEVIEIDTSTFVELDVPIEFDLEESGLAALVRAMSNSLAELAASVQAVGG